MVEEPSGSLAQRPPIDASAPTPPPLPDFITRRVDREPSIVGASAGPGVGVDESQDNAAIDHSAGRFTPNPDTHEGSFLSRRSIRQ
jgi:hypothetical protein